MTKSRQRHRVEMTELCGMPVRSPDGELLGEIEDFSVDMREGLVESARLRLTASPAGRVLRIELPWSLLQLDADKRRLVLDIGLPTLVTVATRRRGLRRD